MDGLAIGVNHWMGLAIRGTNREFNYQRLSGVAVITGLEFYSILLLVLGG